MSRIKSFRDLEVWKKGMALVPEVYGLIAKLPTEERFALGTQLRRAVVSVPANIAEGHARQHRKEFIQSLYIARGSLAEVETLLKLAHRLKYVERSDLAPLGRSSPSAQASFAFRFNRIAA